MTGLPDFRSQEDQLFNFTRVELQKFAEQHREQFAYFAFDCNAVYGEVLLCLDTTSNSRSAAKETENYLLARRGWLSMPYAEIPPYKLEWVVHELGNDLSGFVVPFGNNTGDFSHQGFSQLDFNDWQDFSLEDPQGDFPDSKRSRIECYATVLLSKVIDRLVDASAFASLNRSTPFYCGLGLHDGPQRVLRMID